MRPMEIHEVLKTGTNLKVYPETRRLLRILAARQDLNMAECLHRLIKEAVNGKGD